MDFSFFSFNIKKKKKTVFTRTQTASHCRNLDKQQGGTQYIQPLSLSVPLREIKLKTKRKRGKMKITLIVILAVRHCFTRQTL